jgi:hypothetical protein
MKEKGLRIRKTKEAWRADYKTTTTIQAMSDSEAFSIFFKAPLPYRCILTSHSFGRSLSPIHLQGKGALF